jgi:hypothetical protein
VGANPSLSSNRLSISNLEIQAAPIESQCQVIMVSVYGRWGSHKGCQHL